MSNGDNMKTIRVFRHKNIVNLEFEDEKLAEVMTLAIQGLLKFLKEYEQALKFEEQLAKDPSHLELTDP